MLNVEAITVPHINNDSLSESTDIVLHTLTERSGFFLQMKNNNTLTMHFNNAFACWKVDSLDAVGRAAE